MKALYKLLALILTVVAFSSCEKVINLDLKNAAPQLVIEGTITNVAQAAVVRVSRSVSFDQPNNFPGVSGAVINVSSGGSTINFTESSPGVYQTPPVLARTGRTFTLQAVVDGQTYKASSTMPAPVAMDSIAIDIQSFRGKNTKTMVVYFTDPAGIKNQYRFLMTVNGTPINQVFVRNDEFTDGRSVRVGLFQDDVELKTGDRIDIEMQGIDEKVYTYWYTFAKQSGGSMGAGSVAPANPPNNFDKPVLGYFSAYTINRRTVTIR